MFHFEGNEKKHKKPKLKEKVEKRSWLLPRPTTQPTTITTDNNNNKKFGFYSFHLNEIYSPVITKLI